MVVFCCSQGVFSSPFAFPVSPGAAFSMGALVWHWALEFPLRDVQLSQHNRYQLLFDYRCQVLVRLTDHMCPAQGKAAVSLPVVFFPFLCSLSVPVLV